MIIDTHHHFWKYNPEEYGWIDDEMAVIRQNFLPQDLKKVIEAKRRGWRGFGSCTAKHRRNKNLTSICQRIQFYERRRWLASSC